MGKPLRVVVVSRHALTRAGLTRLLEAEAGRDLVVDCHDGPGQPGCCDVVVYDLGGRDVAEDDELRRLIAGTTAVVVLQADLRTGSSERALAMGAADVISVDVTGEELLASIEGAAAGRRVSPEGLRQQARDAARLANGLTEREVAVLELIAAGLSNAQIAAELYVSINTVKTYVRTAYRRIGADSRAQAVLWTMRQRLGPQIEPAAEGAVLQAAATQ
jgi:NarL family two-component system response regulator LiaR